MSFLFGGSSSPPAVQPAAPIPRDDSAEVAAAKKAERDRILKMRGRKSTILSGAQGDPSEANVGSKTLLGE